MRGYIVVHFLVRLRSRRMRIGVRMRDRRWCQCKDDDDDEAVGSTLHANIHSMDRFNEP